MKNNIRDIIVPILVVVMGSTIAYNCNRIEKDEDWKDNIEQQIEVLKSNDNFKTKILGDMQQDVNELIKKQADNEIKLNTIISLLQNINKWKITYSDYDK